MDERVEVGGQGNARYLREQTPGSVAEPVEEVGEGVQLLAEIRDLLVRAVEVLEAIQDAV